MRFKVLTPVGIFGYRTADLSFTPESEFQFLESMLEYLIRKYTSDGFYIVTGSCDNGFGKSVLRFCNTRKLNFVMIETMVTNHSPKNEYRQHIHPFASKNQLADIHRSRHAAILDLCKEVIVKMPSLPSVLDDLVRRLKVSEIPYYIYDQMNTAIEYRSDPVNGETI